MLYDDMKYEQLAADTSISTALRNSFRIAGGK